MRVVEFTKEQDFDLLRSEWNALVESSPAGSTFVTWEWMAAWWEAYGRSGDLWLLAAFDDDGVMRGLAPLRRTSLQRYGQTFSAIAFIGDGSNDSDYLDFVVAPGWEESVLGAFQSRWSEEMDRGVVLTFNELPAASPHLASLQALRATAGNVGRHNDVPCGTVQLPDSWEAYLAMLRPRFRTKVRSVLRSLEAKPEVRFGFCQTIADVERMLPVLYELHARRWAQDGQPGVFGWDEKRRFYARVSPLLFERGWLRFSWMEWKGRVLACQYGFTFGNTYYHLQEGYEPACEHWSVGIGLRAWTIRQFLTEGMREYDFLGGIGRHKTDWGAEVKQSTQLTVGRATLRNRLLCEGPQWEAKARESVRKYVPQRVLAAKRARAEGRNGTASSPPASERVQHALAEGYFRLGLAGLVRPLREQYELSGSFPKLSLTRRQERSARILYYHRVNDERDRFFPAMSPRLFEQEMRFVSRHYKVVSLGELVRGLDEGLKENVVAITFDDGHRDNYEHAYPILRKYGLPATIFLTTGSIDSREPLWFERLAFALKTTSREFLDLELDLPRRFWLRTQDERLQANDQIFAFLRRVPDPERRERLPHMLAELGSPDESERRGKMLDWDEIRLMKANGIDFGGHTVTHPFLSRMPQEQVTWEVSECKRRIEEELQLQADHFAYPNGREEDFGTWNKQIIRAAGYKAALTTVWGLNYHSTDRMELRRGQPWEEDPAIFAYKLDWYQLVNG